MVLPLDVWCKACAVYSALTGHLIDIKRNDIINIGLFLWAQGSIASVLYKLPREVVIVLNGPRSSIVRKDLEAESP